MWIKCGIHQVLRLRYYILSLEYFFYNNCEYFPNCVYPNPSRELHLFIYLFISLCQLLYMKHVQYMAYKFTNKWMAGRTQQ